MVDKGDDENFRGLKSGQKSFSMCACWVDLYVSVFGLHFIREYLDYWELWKITIVCWIYKVDHVKEGCGSL
jgi:hypothetical protein